MKIVVTVSIALIFTTLLTAQWQVLNSPTNNTLWSVFFTDTSNGWAVGENGTIIHTVDAGITWEFQSGGTNSTLFSVYFVDSFSGWIVGETGTILHTSNAGINWEDQSGVTSFQLWSVQFVNSNLGWAVGGRIIHTTNGGVIWNEQSAPAEALYGVSFIDELNGWAVGGTNGYQYIIHTSDGGSNWYVQSNETGNWLYKVSFVDELNGWISGENGTILHTTDGGNTWLNQNSGGNYLLESVFFVDNNNGWISGDVILQTTDAGNTWNNQDSGTNQPLYSIFFTDLYHGWAVGLNGVIIRTPYLIPVIPVNLNDGWNIFSVPLLAPDMTSTTLFPTAISPFYSYNNGYTQVNTLENGIGYWAKFDGNQTTLVTGTFVTNTEISVEEGWNLIGPFAVDVPVSNITTIPPNIIISPFFAYEIGYNTAVVLNPGKGFWIKTNANGTLHLNINTK